MVPIVPKTYVAGITQKANNKYLSCLKKVCWPCFACYA